jgi:hypothetical protein
MVSRKKAKGKARKAAKGKEKQSTSADEPQVELESQMQRLRLEDLLLNNAARPNSIEEKIQREQQMMLRKHYNAGKCLHGLVPKPDGDICNRFVVEFTKEYNQAIFSGSKLCFALKTARNATQFEYAEVYNDKAKLEWVVSNYLFRGTHRVMDEGNGKGAGVDASFAMFFEEFVAVELTKSRPMAYFAKIIELQLTDIHTTVSFLKKRIPCSCLNEKHKQVKSIKKMGFCCNPLCSQPDGMFERSSLLCCTGCDLVSYCSSECQRADWKKHKFICRK